MPYRCPQCGRQAVGLFRQLATGQGTPASTPVAGPPPTPGQIPGPPAAAATERRPNEIPATSRSAVAPSSTQPLASPPESRPPAASRPVEEAKRPSPRPTPASRPVPAKPTYRPPAADRVAPPAKSPTAVQPTATPRLRPRPIRPKQFLWAWPPEPPYADEAAAIRAAPAVDADGRVYLHTAGRLVALQEHQGQPRLLWEYPTACYAPGPVALVRDGSLRIHTADGFLHALQPSGRQAWAPAMVGEPLGWASPLVDHEGNTFVSAYDGGLIRVDPQGRIPLSRWFRSRQRLDTTGVIHEGVLYIGSEDGYVFALDLAQRGVNRFDHAAEQGYTGWFLNAALVLRDENELLAAAGDEHLYAFSLDGRLAWKTKVPGQMLASPAVDRYGHVYVGASKSLRGEKSSGRLVSLDAHSHRIRWEYRCAGAVESTPVIGDDDLVYFGDNTGTIHAVDSRGQPCWTARVESPVRSRGAILAPRRLAFGLDNGTLVVLECTAGRATSGLSK